MHMKQCSPQQQKRGYLQLNKRRWKGSKLHEKGNSTFNPAELIVDYFHVAHYFNGTCPEQRSPLYLAELTFIVLEMSCWEGGNIYFLFPLLLSAFLRTKKKKTNNCTKIHKKNCKVLGIEKKRVKKKNEFYLFSYLF